MYKCVNPDLRCLKYNPVNQTQSRITVDYENRCSEYDQQYEQILIQSI